MGNETYSPLPRDFFARGATEVAPLLLNCLLVREIEGVRLVGRISETEAYMQEDPASHSFRGSTARNESMFGQPGRAYVYFTYGMHHCFNVVTGDIGTGEAVLIRAVEPLEGLEQMTQNRSLNDKFVSSDLHPFSSARAAANKIQLTVGPGRLCQALKIDRTLTGADLAQIGGVWISFAKPDILAQNQTIIASPRIGITKATDILWRFTLTNDPFVTRKRL